MIHDNNFYYEWVRFIESFAMLEKPALGHMLFSLLKLTLCTKKNDHPFLFNTKESADKDYARKKKCHCRAISYAKLILDISIYIQL
jgi:hypothetical protein